MMKYCNEGAGVVRLRTDVLRRDKPASAGPTAVAVSRATRAWPNILAQLFKARLSSLVLLTTAAGFYMGSPAPAGVLDGKLLWACLMGTGLLAAGAAALNQYLERAPDALMHRTRTRPLPAGDLRPETAVLLGGTLAVAGTVLLALGVNLLTSVLGAVTLMIYLFIYTPLKRKTEWNTLVGAIPGALPPLMGWAAARNQLDGGGWALFAILFFWQLPHFMAIAWLYRDDYERAGFVMMPLVEEGGARTGHHAVTHSAGLLSLSLCPALLGLTGTVYFAGAFLLGIGIVTASLLFARRLGEQRARVLFLASILYLPALLALMAWDKVLVGA